MEHWALLNTCSWAEKTREKEKKPQFIIWTIICEEKARIESRIWHLLDCNFEWYTHGETSVSNTHVVKRETSQAYCWQKRPLFEHQLEIVKSKPSKSCASLLPHCSTQKKKRSHLRFQCIHISSCHRMKADKNFHTHCMQKRLCFVRNYIGVNLSI